MIKQVLFILFIIGVCVCLNNGNPVRSCNHENVMTSLHGENYREIYLNALNKIKNIVGNRTHTRNLVDLRVPVVWHVLTDGPDNLISEATINQEMQWLNDWFSAQNNHYGRRSSFWNGVYAEADDFHITFELASFDLNGNPFNGIDVVQSSVASSCSENDLFFTSQGGTDIWDPKEFYNIYTCEIAGGSLGFAYLPSGPSTHARDGCVLDVRSGQLGNAFYSGSTISHETGHWLGLAHTFEGCTGNGDFVDDTPPTDEPAFDYNNGQCPPDFPDENFQRCSNIVQVQNNMDYNFEECLCFFSKGQVELMRFWLESPPSSSSRGGLNTSPALSPRCPTFDCVNKDCGDDGCNEGGVCGVCGANSECNQQQQCESIPIVNEVCSGAIELSFVTSPGDSSSGDNTGAGNPTDSCEPGTHDFPLYYTFTPLFSSTARIYTDSDILDTTLSIFSGSCGSLSCVDFNDDINYYGGDLLSEVNIQVTGGVTYYIIVSGYSTGQGSFTITVENTGECTPNCDGKTCGDNGCNDVCGTCGEGFFCNTQDNCEEIETNNDLCSQATSILGNTVLDNENNLISTIDNIVCDMDVTWGVWYEFIGTGNQITIDTCADVNLDTVIHVFSGSCGTLLCIGSNDDGCSNSLGSMFTFCSESGVNYYFAVDGYNARLGNFDFTFTDTEISCNPEPKNNIIKSIDNNINNNNNNNINSFNKNSKQVISQKIISKDIFAANDLCVNAMDLNNLGFPNSPVEVTASTKTSTVPFDFGCISSESRGLWYTFTGTGSMVHIDTCTPSSDMYESIIHVISGSCSNTVCEAYTRNINSHPTCNLGGDAVFCTNNAVQYWIFVEGQNLQQGEFILNIFDTELSCSEPSNSICSTAQTISVSSPITVTHKDYPPSPITDCDLVGSPDGSDKFSNVAWYQFVATSSEQYSIDICSDLVGDFKIRVYEGTTCSDKICFGTSGDGQSCNGVPSQNTREFCTQTGLTYFIAIYDGYGSFTLNLNNDGQCQRPCIPVCGSGSICTGDTCGGTCGTCIGTCVNEVCIPNPDPCPSAMISPSSPSLALSPSSPSLALSPSSPSLALSPSSPSVAISPSSSSLELSPSAPVTPTSSVVTTPGSPSAAQSPSSTRSPTGSESRRVEETPSSSNSRQPDETDTESQTTFFSSITSIFSTFSSISLSSFSFSSTSSSFDTTSSSTTGDSSSISSALTVSISIIISTILLSI